MTGGILLSNRHGDEAKADSVSQTVRTGTAVVDEGDLRGTTTKQGTLAGTPGATVPVGPSGTLTSIPAVGTVVKPRDELYRVDNQPVTYFSGALPQWRAFEQGMNDGPDIKQLEENLHTWGYLGQAPTEHFDWNTRVAIDRWQRDTGQPRTGTIELGRIWFGRGDQVVSDRRVDVGQQVAPGAPAYSTTGTTKVATVDLPVGSPLAKVGGAAEVQVPTVGTLPGKVTRVGDPATDDDGKVTVPVTVSFDDPTKVGGLSRLDVSVDFVSATRKHVLSVPVTALGAKNGGGFVVQTVGDGGVIKNVSVEVGLFAGDRVEVTKGALRAGQKVVVPA
ncbi:hypothetical protein AX769_07740 [Frondihabitans sp. PAMC 28766]|nr:hypothetical protein AX769_07740 [Frondihabitans sp. PAMC 28766]